MSEQRKRKDYPYWAYPSRRAFRVQKRAAVRRVLKALDELRLGCAYTPAKDIGVVTEQVREWQRLMSVKEWGR